jgi:hypothetical protein
MDSKKIEWFFGRLEKEISDGSKVGNELDGRQV